MHNIVVFSFLIFTGFALSCDVRSSCYKCLQSELCEYIITKDNKYLCVSNSEAFDHVRIVVHDISDCRKNVMSIRRVGNIAVVSSRGQTDNIGITKSNDTLFNGNGVTTSTTTSQPPKLLKIVPTIASTTTTSTTTSQPPKPLKIVPTNPSIKPTITTAVPLFRNKVFQNAPMYNVGSLINPSRSTHFVTTAAPIFTKKRANVNPTQAALLHNSFSTTTGMQIQNTQRPTVEGGSTTEASTAHETTEKQVENKTQKPVAVDIGDGQLGLASRPSGHNVTRPNTREIFMLVPSRLDCKGGQRNESNLVKYVISLCTMAHYTKKYGTKNLSLYDAGYLQMNRALDFPVVCEALREYRRRCRVEKKASIKLVRSGTYYYTGMRSPFFDSLDTHISCDTGVLKEPQSHKLARSICRSGQLYFPVAGEMQLVHTDSAYGQLNLSLRHKNKCLALHYKKSRCY